jgi:uncharacterized protein YodC (DUF2158 family)
MFKSGNVVILKKDGTRMTIRAINKNIITCDWFDKQNQFHRETISPEKLELIPA